MTHTSARIDQSDAFIYRAALLALAAGVTHGIATAQYIRDWWGYGVFFMVVALAEIMLGLVLLIRPWQYDETGGIRAAGTKHARTLFVLGVVGCGMLIVLYLVTRTVGIPLLGPLAGRVEPVTLLGVASKIVELALVIHLVTLIRQIDTNRVG